LILSGNAYSGAMDITWPFNTEKIIGVFILHAVPKSVKNEQAVAQKGIHLSGH